MSPSDACIFDEIVTGARPAFVVLDETELMGFLDTRPVFPGHTLIVPRQHVATVMDLPAGMLGPLLDAGRRVAAAQRAALGAGGTVVAIDGYHGFMAVPTDLSRIAGRAFYLAGGYKYAMAGEGVCFLHCPPERFGV